MTNARDNATDQGCEQDKYPYRGPAWGVAAVVLVGAVVWALAVIGVMAIWRSIKGG